MLKTLFKIVFFGVLLSICHISMAEEIQTIEISNQSPFRFHRSDLNRIKIISTSADNHTMYLVDKNNRGFRISGMSQESAEALLQRLKSDNELVLHTTPNKKRDYDDVVSWK